MPGSMPFMLRIILAIPPLENCFIIFCVCSNCLSSRLTSCTGTPAPAAMRRLRLALRISGFRTALELPGGRGKLRRQLVHQRAETTHLAHLADLRLEVLEVETLSGLELLRQFARLLLIHATAGLLDQT
jgi:hypothetical protein